MHLYEVALTSKVVGRFRVVACDLGEATRKAQLIFANGVDHDIDQIETLWAKEIAMEKNNE